MDVWCVKGETEHGELKIKSGFPSREEAEDYPVTMSHWKRVWVEIDPSPPPPPCPTETGPAPGPYTLETSASPSPNGAFHVYIVDATGRRIGAIWGQGERKIATAELILSAANEAIANRTTRA